MKDRFLPIGSVVLLDGGTKCVMITSYMVMSKDDANKQVFEYGGCMYPEGIVNSDITLCFNHDQIKQIVHLGYESKEQEAISKDLNERYDQIKKGMFDEKN